VTGHRRRRDSGSVAVEAVLVVPVLFAVIALALAAGRLSNAQGDLDAAARYAARQISIARIPEAATAAAEADASTTLHVGEPTCRSMHFQPTITPTEVTVRIECTVALGGSTALPIPGSVTLAATGVESVDANREIGP
jgi:Flp pilus assembly protein TadG